MSVVVASPSRHRLSRRKSGSTRVLRCSSTLLFDLELTDEVQPAPKHDASHFEQARVGIAALLNGCTQKLLQHVHETLDALRRTNHQQPGPEQVAVLLRLQGYHAFVRRATGPRGIEGCLRTLRHSFVVVQDPNDMSEELIVDIGFRDNFLLAQSTQDYDAFLAALPTVFAGPISILQPIVHTACQAIAVTYHSLGLSVPPWRGALAMMTKWQPEDFVDVPCSLAQDEYVQGKGYGQRDDGYGDDSDEIVASPTSVISPVPSQQRLYDN